MEHKYHCKLVLLGAMSVGKTSFVWRFVKGKFDEDIKETVGAAFSTRTMTKGQNEITFEIWDTAGHEKYKAIAPFYYRDSAAAIVMYDITDAESFETAKEWVERLRSEVNDKLILVIVGNKSDLADSGKRAVNADEARAYAELHGSILIEASVKNDVNVFETFQRNRRYCPRNF
eukprot:gnl/Chilomastix_caulleri/1618.p1 GENE.gnl/Chilomastix_caulleri/1618~~gnl/Chilomastix_caulleri/1618.p1  ORF type:complete len:174 (-),score=25.30 gnl/Chilomastix_caulleri/1618:3-524(-)